MSIWALLYFVPLVYLAGLSSGKENRDIKIITSVSLVAFVFTRLISEYVEGGRYMWDLANDLMVVAIMLIFIGYRPLVLLLVATYGCMTLFSYLPYLEGTITKQDNYVILEIIGKIQLLIIFESLNGYLKSSWRRHIIPTWARAYIKLAGVYSRLVGTSHNVGGNSGVLSYIPNKSGGVPPSDIPFKSGAHANMAKDN